MIWLIYIKILILFDDMIADMLGRKRKLQPIVTELFNRSIKKNHFSCFYCTILFYFTEKYLIELHALLYYGNSKEMRASTMSGINRLSDIDFKDLTKFYKNCAAKQYSF